jgi:uncharacterized tellurite resistance protein B-like protein
MVGADRVMDRKEREVLYDLLAYFTSKPENYIQFKDYQEIVSRKDAICEYYANANNDYKFRLFEDIIYIAICDGRLAEEEIAVIKEIAQKVKIDEKRANEIVQYMVTKYLQPVSPQDNNMNGNFFNPLNT